MSLYNDASIVITPNGQKAGKLYSIKPGDGSGDLSVVRATSATRVDANGLVEIPRTNLLTYSEQFNDASWLKAGVSVTTNTTTAPNGTLTADSVIENSATATQHRMARFSISLTIGTTYTISAYVKRGVGSRNVQFGSSGAGTWIRVYFDLTNGTVGSQVNGTGTITNVGDGWYKITATGVCDLTGNNAFYLANTNGTTAGSETYNGDGVSSIVWWGAQLEQGVSATEYIPTVASIRTKFAGITQDGSSASNIPRLDYTNGSCPSILVEPQRTNLLLRSEEFNDASWVKTNATVTSNTTTAPDGTLTADTINISVQDVERVIQRVLTGVSITGITYRASIWVKGQGTNIGKLVRFRVKRNSGGSMSDAIINHTLTSDWVRISIGFTGIADNTGVSFGFDGATGYADSFDVWGAQLEVGSNATSYIPTTSASVTRNADVISKTGISSLIGQTEGTILLDFELQPNNINGNYLFSLSDGTTANLIRSEIFILSPTVSQFRTGLTTAGVGQGDNFTTITQLRNKMAISYSLNNFKLFINGVLVYTDITATIPATSGFYLGNRIGVGNIIGANYKLASLFKTQLTDDECINLTTI
jgi:hypothetical protein